MRIPTSEPIEKKTEISEKNITTLTSGDIVLPDAEVKPASLRLEMKEWNISVNKRTAYEAVVPRKFEDVAELLSYGKHFFAMAAGMKYQFADDYPDKIDKDNKESQQKVIGKTYYGYVPGIEESPGSCYRIRDMVYNRDKLHYLVVLDKPSPKMLATAYYLFFSYEVNSENLNTSKIYFEAGFSSGKLSEYMFEKLILRNLKIPLKHILRWMTHPEDAARREIIRRSLIASKDITSVGSSQYTIRYKVLVSASEVLSLLNQGKRLAEKIIGVQKYNPDGSFVKDFPVIGEIYLQRQKANENQVLYSSTMPDYSMKSLFKAAVFSFSILFQIEKQDDTQTIVVLTLMSSPLLANKNEMTRVQLNYALINSCSTMFGHLVNEISHDKKTRENITPEIDILKVIPEEIRPCLALGR